MTFASSVLITRLLVDHLYKSPVTVTGVSAGPSGAPEAAVRSSRRRRRQRFCRGNLLQDLPAVCGVQPPPAPDTPEPAAGPAHWYTSVLCIIHLCTWLSEPIVFCLHVSEACASPPQSRLVYCYPVRLAIPSPPLPRVELHFENDMACLRFRGEMVKVNRGHFSKLVSSPVVI